MKIFACFFTIVITTNLLGQDLDHVKSAKRFHKQKVYHLAVAFSAKALMDYTSLSKRELSNVRDYIREDYPKVLESLKNEMSNLILKDTSELKENARILAYENLIKSIQNMISLNDHLSKVPKDALIFSKKEEENIVLDLKDFSKDLATIKLEYSDAKNFTAERHYLKANKLKSANTINDQISSLHEFEKSMKYIEDYKDTKPQISLVRNSISNKYFEKGKKQIITNGDIEDALNSIKEGRKYCNDSIVYDTEFLKLHKNIAKNYLENGKKLFNSEKIGDVEKALLVFKKGVNYHPENTEFPLVIETTKNNLLKLYLERGKGLSSKNTPKDWEEVISFYDRSLTFLPGNTQLLKSKTEATDILVELYYQQILTLKQPSNLAKSYDENSSAILDVISSIKKYKLNYKDIDKYYNEARQYSPVFTDSRDGQKYKLVRVGEMVWMTENLNYIGDVGVYPKSIKYDGSSEIYKGSGAYYKPKDLLTGIVAEGGQGICPNGFHVATEKEFNMLKNYLINQEASYLRGYTESRYDEYMKKSIWFKLNFKNGGYVRPQLDNSSELRVIGGEALFLLSTPTDKSLTKFKIYSQTFSASGRYIDTFNYNDLGLRNHIFDAFINDGDYFNCRCVKN